ncbi:MAG: T9SS type A sorting domain-containing protein [Candidatus Kapabacteria bacterium]|jgi:photosystem II stability/assembly factor-like uncharacterized protein|nr:T9SS type A sorting domain-containing protein [Candidatus Kapabacteria bacterium]
MNISIQKLFVTLIIFCLGSAILSADSDAPNAESQTVNYYDLKHEFDQWAKDKDLSNTRGWKFHQRMLWEMSRHADPLGNMPTPEETAEVYKQITAMTENKGNLLLGESGWTPLGPHYVPESYDPISGIGVGRVNCVAFHPTDVNTLWVGTPNAGVWKTEDNGESWIPLSDKLISTAISDIKIDPVDPDIVYIVTGDYDFFSLNSYRNQGIYITIDGGLTWAPAAGAEQYETFGRGSYREMLINRDDNKKLLAIGSGRIMKSDDAGETWYRTKDTLYLSDVVVDPVNPNLLYGANRNINANLGLSQILKSTDFGDSWEVLETGMSPEGDITRMALTVAPADPNYIYVIAVSKANRGGLNSIYMSSDAGDSWSKQTDPVEKHNIMGWYDGDETDRKGQGWYDLVILTDPEDASKVYAGGVSLWGSDNYGVDWDLATYWMYTFGPSIHADQHFAGINPLNNRMYFCNDGGIYSTDKITLGSKDWITEWIDKPNENVFPGMPDSCRFETKWHNHSNGLAITEFYKLGISRNNAGYVNGGSQDNSSMYYDGEKWINFIVNYDGMQSMIDNDDPQTIYGCYQFGGLCKSTVGGINVDMHLTSTITGEASDTASWVTPFYMDVTDPDILYGGYKNLWKSDDGGKNWRVFFNTDSVAVLTGNRRNIIAIRSTFQTDSLTNNLPNIVAFTRPTKKYYKDTMFAAELWATYDDGASWKDISGNLPLDTISVYSFDFDENNSDHIYAAMQRFDATRKVYETYDGGDNWANITKGMPNATINVIRHDRTSNYNLVYVATTSGVFYTNDTMDVWVAYSENLARNNATDFDIQYNSRKLYLSSYGRGMWIADMIEANVSVNEYAKAIHATTITISPNPANNNFTAKIDLSDPAIIGKTATADIVDIHGQVVYSENINLSSGSFSREFKTSLINGAYYFRLSVGNSSKTVKLMIMD